MLIDAGPLVSLCDHKQPTHARCRAVLEAVSETLGDRTVFTWDSDFRAYRMADRRTFEVVPE